METLDNDVTATEGIVINSNGKANLLESSKWGNFLAIVGFVMLGLMVLGGLFVMVAGASIGSGQFGMFGIIYIIVAALYFFPILYLFNFARKIKTGLSNGSQADVDTALENLKSMLKFMGIFMIVILSFYALIFIFGGAMSFMM